MIIIHNDFWHIMLYHTIESYERRRAQWVLGARHTLSGVREVVDGVGKGWLGHGA